MIKIGVVPKTVLFFAALVVVNVFLFSFFTKNSASTLVWIGFISFAGLAIFLALRTKKALDYFRHSLEYLTKNSLDEKVALQSRDEFGQVAEALDTFRSSLKEKISASEGAKDRLEAILFNVGEGVFAVNLSGEIIIFNQVAENLVGFSREQAIGQPYDQILQFYNPKAKSYYGAFIDDVLLEGRSIILPADTLLISATQNRIPVAVNSSPIRNEKGIIIGGVVVFRDTTKEQQVEEMRNDLVSIASHQLRTPLSEIKGLLELLLDNVAGPLNTQQKEYLDLLGVANTRMINLVNDLLNLSRIEQGRIQFQFNVYDLGVIAQEAFEGLQVHAQKKSQIFNLTRDNGQHLVWVDSAKTKEIISNLLENALKYTFEGGTIQARVSSTDEGVWFLVRDSGVGIPKNAQGELFKKFARIENPLSRVTSGTGLGLFTVKELVEKQSGKVWVQSEEGKGSTFAFILPHAKTLPESKQA